MVVARRPVSLDTECRVGETALKGGQAPVQAQAQAQAQVLVLVLTTPSARRVVATTRLTPAAVQR